MKTFTKILETLITFLAWVFAISVGICQYIGTAVQILYVELRHIWAGKPEEVAPG